MRGKILFLILLIGLLIFPQSVSAWGSITHQTIAVESLKQSEVNKLNEIALKYFRGGTVMPDFCLAIAYVTNWRSPLSKYHGKFHSSKYWKNMWKLARNKNEKVFC